MIRFFKREATKEWEREIEKEQENNKTKKIPKKLLIPLSVLVFLLLSFLGAFIFFGEEESPPSQPLPPKPAKNSQFTFQVKVAKEPFVLNSTEVTVKVPSKPQKEVPKKTPPKEEEKVPSLESDKFVGTYVRQAIEDIKEALKRELEAKYRKKFSNEEKKEIKLNEESLPSVIVVDGIMEFPNGDYILRIGNKEVVPGIELFNGWTVIKIDKNYLYLQKRTSKLVVKNGKTEKVETVKRKKIRYIFGY